MITFLWARQHFIKPKPIRIVWNSPPFNLKRIIDSRDGKMAILEDVSVENLYLKWGDTLRRIRILAIESICI